MKNKYILFILFFSFSLEATITGYPKRSFKELKTDYEIPEHACSVEGGEIDYSERFGPVRDQDGHGFCWSFVGADLVSEQLCQERYHYCNRPLSILDGSRDAWTMGEKSEGGRKDYVLKTMIKGGMCLEEHAPYHESNSWICNAFWGENNCATRKISKHINRFFKHYDWYKFTDDLSCLTEGRIFDELNRLEKNLKKINEKIFFTRRDLIDAIENSYSNPKEFLRQFLITPQCRKNRISFAGNKDSYESKLINFAYKKKSNDQFVTPSNVSKLQTIKRVLQDKKRSTALAFCSSQIFKDFNFIQKLKKLSNPLAEDCGQHVISVVGMRWNTKKKRCELKTRNSWGKGAPLNGWMNAEKLLNTTFAINYLEVK